MAGLIGRPHDSRVAATFVPFLSEAVVGIVPTGTSASGTRHAEASRDDRLDGAHAHIPAGIYSSTVQLGALSQSPRSRAPCGGFEQRLRARLQGSGPALAPRRTRLRPRCDLNARPRPRLGQLPRGDARQGDLPTCDQPLAGHVPPGSRHPDQPDKILRDRTQLSTSRRRRNPATSPVVQQGEDCLVSPAGLSATRQLQGLGSARDLRRDGDGTPSAAQGPTAGGSRRTQTHPAPARLRPSGRDRHLLGGTLRRGPSGSC
jgi:hypothetical protein